MIFRKNIQQSCEMRWASPSTPESWRMMSCIALTVLRTDISSSFHLVQGGLEFIYRKHEVRASTEFLNQLHGRSHRIKRRDLQDARVAKIDDALILVFLEQGFKHGAGLGAVSGEDIALADIVCALAAREGRTV